MLAEELNQKWKMVLEHPDLTPISDPHRRNVTAQLLENTAFALRENQAHSQFLLTETSPTNSMSASSSTPSSGAIDTFDPVLISLVRRAMPNLMAYDVCGVQQMTGPTGLIFAMRARYANQAGDETFYNEVNTAFSTLREANTTVFGNNHTDTGGIPGQSNIAAMTTVENYNAAFGMSTETAEGLGSNSLLIFPEMALSIEKLSVTAQSRALKAEYSMELAQDLKAIHGLDAETELSNILSAEILAEINREVVRTINVVAKVGAQTDTVTPGIFNLDTDSNGRWSVEKFKGLMFQLEREANKIAKETRRGKGNIVICSADVASALQMAGVLDYTPALNSNNLQIDDTGNTFAGVLNGRFRVYIDPYAIGGNYLTVGYKGSNAFDAGLFYCPYVPLQMVRAVDPDTFQPKIGFKTRYGMVANPYAKGATAITYPQSGLEMNTNVYYRKMIVLNLM
jgi:Major capsid protein Gp23